MAQGCFLNFTFLSWAAVLWDFSRWYCGAQFSPPPSSSLLSSFPELHSHAGLRRHEYYCFHDAALCLLCWTALNKQEHSEEFLPGSGWVRFVWPWLYNGASGKWQMTTTTTTTTYQMLPSLNIKSGLSLPWRTNHVFSQHPVASCLSPYALPPLSPAPHTHCMASFGREK